MKCLKCGNKLPKGRWKFCSKKCSLYFYNKIWRTENKEKINEKNKKWQREHREITSKRANIWYHKNKEDRNYKRSAERKTKKLLKKINVNKGEQFCYICGKQAQCIHHNDYKNPYNITWLCNTCHQRLHRFYKNDYDISEDC